MARVPPGRRRSLVTAGVCALIGCGDSTGPERDPRLFTAVSAGASYTCGIRADSTLVCWGLNNSGQLGDGTEEDRHVPTAIVSELRFTDVSAGEGHTCAIAHGGSAYCWGSNAYGQLGDSTSNSPTPIPVTADLVFTTISVAGNRTCALASDGAPYCWGENGGGSLGDGTVGTDDLLVPTRAGGQLHFVLLSAGPGHTCGVTADRTLYCWGANTWGQLGATTTDICGEGAAVTPCSLTPLQVSSNIGFVQVALGPSGTCGIASDGTAYCWGLNSKGQLGDGTESDRSVPTPVALDLALASISQGDGHTCGITVDGPTYCWGWNYRGKLGDGTSQSSLVPSLVATSAFFETLSAGYYHTCAIDRAGTMYCWGSNQSGQLGDDSGALGWATPVAVRH